MNTKKVSIGAKPTNKPAVPVADAWVESRAAADVPEAMKRLTIDVPDSLNRAIKMQCAARGTKIADEVRELLRQLQNDPLTADYRSAWGKTGEPGAAITGTMQGIETNITHPNMNISERTSMRQRLKAVQDELIEGLDAGMGAPTTPTLERLVHILDWLRVEELVADGCGVGRPPRERFALANAFIAKVVLRLPTTVALIDRLKVDRTLRRICGFAWFKGSRCAATEQRGMRRLLPMDA